MVQWYGYLHINNSVHIKRYFSAEDINEVCQSDFVKSIFGPIEAEDRDEAEKIIYKHYNVKGY